MDWLAYEIKLGALIASLSTVYCKFDSLNICILHYCVVMAMCMCFLSLYVTAN